MKSETSYKVRRCIDILLPITFIFFAVLWFIQSIYTIIITQSFFSAIHLWILGFPMHVTTALNLTLIYLINFFFFRTFLPGHQRVTRALLFAALGFVSYDLFWSLCCVTLNGYGSFILPLVSMAVVIEFIVIIHKKQTLILNFNWKVILPTITIFFITVAILLLSGFFQQFALMEQGLATDPHSWEWLLNKTVTLWMWFSVALP